MLTRDALVVDDDADGREALAQVLEAQGYTVRQAENGRVALDRIGERLPCLMLLDLQMPVLSGWEVLACLRLDPARKAMAVVVLSAMASAPPDVTFLRKPCPIGALLDAIRAAHALQREQLRMEGESTPRSDGQRSFTGGSGPGSLNVTSTARHACSLGLAP